MVSATNQTTTPTFLRATDTIFADTYLCGWRGSLIVDEAEVAL